MQLTWLVAGVLLMSCGPKGDWAPGTEPSTPAPSDRPKVLAELPTGDTVVILRAEPCEDGGRRIVLTTERSRHATDQWIACRITQERGYFWETLSVVPEEDREIYASLEVHPVRLAAKVHGWVLDTNAGSDETTTHQELVVLVGSRLKTVWETEGMGMELRTSVSVEHDADGMGALVYEERQDLSDGGPSDVLDALTLRRGVWQAGHLRWVDLPVWGSILGEFEQDYEASEAAYELKNACKKDTYGSVLALGPSDVPMAGIANAAVVLWARTETDARAMAEKLKECGIRTPPVKRLR